MKMKLVFLVLAVMLAFGVLFTSCGTIMKAKAINVTAESGAKAEVAIEQNGVNLYKGPLPARIDVSGAGFNPLAGINVHYTDKDGNPAVHKINKMFNFWTLLFSPAIVPLIVDIATGSVFTYNFSKKQIPINYNYQPKTQQPEMELWVVEELTPEMMKDLVYVGSLND